MNIITKSKLLTLFASLVFFISPWNVWGQQPNNDIDTSLFIAIDEANYDSLLHNFYMQQYLQSSQNKINRRTSMAYAEFDNIPDSVFINRLNAMHTVVPMTYNPEVRAYIKIYVRIMSRRIDAMLSLSEYYFPMFEETLDRYGVPEELKYLSIVESALNPQATSRAGAAGLWQFMYSTGKNYNLEVNSLVDERRDPFKSTVAAARYLRALYDTYHDWHLAMAAYNCGPGNVSKAIARSGGKKNFWQIYQYLPRETRRYIPAFIGASYVMNYYHEHGIAPSKHEIPLKTDTVNLHNDVHFASVERFTGIPISQLRQLNPQFRADMVPASSRPYAICLPASKASSFITFEDSIYSNSKQDINRQESSQSTTNTVIYHKVRKGETFNSIAKKYGVSVSNLRRWNGKSKKSALKVGTRLKIYMPAPESNTAQNTMENSVADTTASVSDSTANNQPTAVAPAKPATTKPATAKPTYHTVRNGESLSIIAKKYHTTADQLKKLNHLKSDLIHPGQKLKVRP